MTGRHKTPQQLALPLDRVSLRRIDPTRNMARFYSMAVERDLFDVVVLVRQWGRINGLGRTRLDAYRGEGEAMAALTVLEAAKRRRGYNRAL